MASVQIKMDVDLGIWSKLIRLVVALIVVSVLLGVAIWYLPLIRQNQAMRQDILQLEQQIRKEETLSKQQNARILSLQRNPKTIERLARERLSYAKTGEIIIQFEAPALNQQTNRLQ